LVTEAREMNMNCFRTHTQPPPKHWADICDENGTMILAELPVTYNHRNCGFTPEEYEIWHKNVLTDAEGWLSRLWNHPSVIMWVLSNESHLDNEWESGPYRDFVLELDPTRPTMRTGDTKYMGSFSPSHAEVGGTEENLDIHTCYNVNRWTAEGVLQEKMPEWFLDAKNRTKTNTEYMNIFKTPPEQWTGINDKEAYDMVYAQLGMEHTEAMRRARLDCVLPYMYAGWTKTRTGREWKAGFAKPVSACWHSSLSPVLASLDLFNPNYHVGQKVTSDLYLINDSWHDAEVHVDLLITKECPEFIPEAECFENPLMKWSYDFTMKADNMVKTPIQWKLPDEEGNYWLTARLKGIPGRPVLSQRFVRAVKPVVVTESAKKRTFIILGSDDRSDKYFRSKNFITSEKLNDLNPEKNIVLIWNTKNLTQEEKQSTTILYDFAESGGRIVILSTDVWDWKELCNVSVDSSQWSLPFSRVFMSKGVHHFMLSGIHKEHLIRWNGLPGTVALQKIKGPALEGAHRILWASEPNSTIAAEIPIAGSKGKILFTQLDIQNHLDDSRADYDPVAERIFLNLLGE
ncbi:hypothetical protein KAS50_01335, partial [bacterium]|nr:hypothetical protein [bacterium]